MPRFLLKSQPFLVYLKYWTLNINPLIVYPKVEVRLGFRICERMHAQSKLSLEAMQGCSQQACRLTGHRADTATAGLEQRG